MGPGLFAPASPLFDPKSSLSAKCADFFGNLPGQVVCTAQFGATVQVISSESLRVRCQDAGAL
jgi:hypothetical protein